MSFSKCSNLEAKIVIHLKIKIKEKFKLKTKPTKKKNPFHTSYAESFQLPNAI